jgi:hypothetical protein
VGGVIRYVAVVGPGETASAEQCAIAADVGRLLAEAGCVVVTGGLGGVMAAAIRGCEAAGGTSVGLLPGDDRTAAPVAASIAVPTGLGELRNGLVVRAADAVIAIGGSWGTASEVALAMRTGRPTVAIDGWRFLDSGGIEVPVPQATDARDAVAAVLC